MPSWACWREFEGAEVSHEGSLRTYLSISLVCSDDGGTLWLLGALACASAILFAASLFPISFHSLLAGIGHSVKTLLHVAFARFRSRACLSCCQPITFPRHVYDYHELSFNGCGWVSKAKPHKKSKEDLCHLIGYLPWRHRGQQRPADSFRPGKMRGPPRAGPEQEFTTVQVTLL